MSIGDVLVMFEHNYGVWTVFLGCKEGLKSVETIWCPFFSFSFG